MFEEVKLTLSLMGSVKAEQRGPLYIHNHYEAMRWPKHAVKRSEKYDCYEVTCDKVHLRLQNEHSLRCFLVDNHWWMALFDVNLRLEQAEGNGVEDLYQALNELLEKVK